MTDKIKEAYQSSKDIYDEVLTQGNFLSRLHIKVFWSGTAVFTERKMEIVVRCTNNLPGLQRG